MALYLPCFLPLSSLFYLYSPDALPFSPCAIPTPFLRGSYTPILPPPCLLLFPQLSLFFFFGRPFSPSFFIRGLLTRPHNKESYDFMVGGRQQRAFIGPTIGRLMARWIQIRRVRAGHHTTSSFYHVVPSLTRAAVVTYRRCHGLPRDFDAKSGVRMGVPLEKWETVWRTKVDAEVDRLLGVLCSRYGTSWVLVWLVNALLLDNGGILRASTVFFSFW